MNSNKQDLIEKLSSKRPRSCKVRAFRNDAASDENCS
jgi:hypothetical protein